MAQSIRNRLWDVALDQYGYVTSHDARRLNVPVVELGKLAARGRLKRVGYGLYRFEELPLTDLSSYMLATLWPAGHGVLSHDTALELHELCDINPTRIHVTIPPRLRIRRKDGERYVVHKEALGRHEIGKFERIPIVRPLTAIGQGIVSGVRSGLIDQAITTARSTGAITREQEADLRGRAEGDR